MSLQCDAKQTVCLSLLGTLFMFALFVVIVRLTFLFDEGDERGQEAAHSCGLKGKRWSRRSLVS